MKIGGIDPKTLPTEDYLVLPRGEGQLVVRAHAVPDMEAFAALCPIPKAPGKLTKNGFVPDEEDEGYKSLIAKHNRQWLGYVVINSLLEVQWDSVQPDDPSTWVNWETDLKNAGLSVIERKHVLSLVMGCNSLDEQKLQAARELFQRGGQTQLAL